MLQTEFYSCNLGFLWYNERVSFYFKERIKLIGVEYVSKEKSVYGNHDLLSRCCSCAVQPLCGRHDTISEYLFIGIWRKSEKSVQCSGGITCGSFLFYENIKYLRRIIKRKRFHQHK